MVKQFKAFWVAVVLLATAPSLLGFSLLGPSPASGATNPALSWQTQDIGYNALGTFHGFTDLGSPIVSTSLGFEIGGPVNLGEEYRWNLPMITYAFDKSFRDYFGADGMDAVESAFETLNRLPRFSEIDFQNYPLAAQRINFQASALGLLDVKSLAMQVILEELGLAAPERFAWAIRERRVFTTQNNTMFTNWLVINRNFDPVTFEPTPFVNERLYSYRIFDFPPDTGAGFPAFEDAVEIPVDLPNLRNSAVAGNDLSIGGYFIGLTRDDVGGLHYLYRPDNVNVERLPGDTTVVLTNTNSPVLLRTIDLGTFIEETTDTTNTVTNINALFPDANVVNVTSNLASETLTNIVTSFTNFPDNPTRVLSTNIVNTNFIIFNYEFDNIVTNTTFNNTSATHVEVEVVQGADFVPGIGTLVTNVTTNTSSSLTTNFPDGEIYFVPVNLLEFQFVSTQLVEEITRTNIISTNLGNLFAFTNTEPEVGVFTEDLAFLRENTLGTTNDPAAVMALFPDLFISRTNTRFTNIMVTNFLGSNVVVSNFFANVFDYTLANVFTLDETNQTWFTNKLVEIAANPFAGLPDQGLFTTNDLLAPVVAAGGDVSLVDGAIVTSPAVASLAPAGADNDLLFASKLGGFVHNGVEIRFIDDGTLSDNRAEARFDEANRLLIVNIASGVTDAGAVVAALTDPVTSGGTEATFASESFDFIQNTVDDEFVVRSTIAGPSGNGLQIFIDDDPSLAGDTANASFDFIFDHLIVSINLDVTRIATIVDAINGIAAPAFTFEAVLAAGGDGSLVVPTGALKTGIPETSGGQAGTASSGLLSVAGDDNDLLFTSVSGSVTNNGLRVILFDSGGSARSNRAFASYDTNANELLIDIDSGFTRANTIVNAIATSGSADMAAFRARYDVALDTSLDAGNDGTGTLSWNPFVAALDLSVETANTGAGTLGANVNVAVLDAFTSGEFFLVPTNLLGYDLISPLATNITNESTIIFTNETAVFTNTSSPIVVSNIDLSVFSEALLTNTTVAAAETAIGLPSGTLVVTGTNTLITNLVTETVTAVLTNLSPYAPAVNPPDIVFLTNRTTNVAPVFTYSFGNVITNEPVSSERTFEFRRTELIRNPFSPATSTNALTNVITTVETTNFPSGSIIVIPTNTTPRLFGFDIIETNLTVVTAFTNNVFSLLVTNLGIAFSNTLDRVTFMTNTFFTAHPVEFVNPTNIGVSTAGIRQEVTRRIQRRAFNAHEIQIATNGPGLEENVLSRREEIVTRTTNTTFLVNPVEFQPFAAGQTALRRGVDKLTFTNITGVSHEDGFEPTTNMFPTTVVTNFQNRTQWVRRIATTPDFLFTAEDLGSVGGPLRPFSHVRTTASGWANNSAIDGSGTLAGPGVITNTVVITFTTLTPSRVNDSDFNLDAANASRNFTWGSFDGSGRPPIVYPSSNSISKIEARILTNAPAP